MVDLQTISVVIAAGSIVLGIVTWISQNREMKEIQQTRLFMEIWQYYNSVEYALQRYEAYDMQWEDYDDFNRKYWQVPTEDKKPYASYISMGRTFEGLGLLVQKKLIDIELIYQLFNVDIIRWWEKFEPRFEELTSRGIYHGFDNVVESLYNEMKKLRDQRRLSPVPSFAVLKGRQ